MEERNPKLFMRPQMSGKARENKEEAIVLLVKVNKNYCVTRPALIKSTKLYISLNS